MYRDVTVSLANRSCVHRTDCSKHSCNQHWQMSPSNRKWGLPPFRRSMQHPITSSHKQSQKESVQILNVVSDQNRRVPLVYYCTNLKHTSAGSCADLRTYSDNWAYFDDISVSPNARYQRFFRVLKKQDDVLFERVHVLNQPHTGWIITLKRWTSSIKDLTETVSTVLESVKQ